MKELSTPFIEKLKVQHAELTIRVDMELASLPVTITGRYVVTGNVFYPETVSVKSDACESDGVMENTTYPLDQACHTLGWDEFETSDSIRDAVEGSL